MNDHYYSHTPVSAHHERLIETKLLGREMRFNTDSGVFSRDDVDPGSRLLIESAGPLSGRVLDLGCGWGPVGLSLALENPKADFLMADINERAVELTERNRRLNGVLNARVIESDSFESIEGQFEHILTNPPIRAGKQVIYKMFADAAKCLNNGGALYLVIRKQQGAQSCVKYLKTLYASVEKLDKSGGFWVLKACEPLKGENTDEV